MHKVGHTLHISDCFAFHTRRVDEDPPDTELILEPLLKLSFFVAHALYHHAGTLSDPPAASSQLLSAIQSDVPKGLSSSLSRKMANLALGGGTSQQENQFSIGQGKGLNQVSQVCVPSLIN